MVNTGINRTLLECIIVTCISQLIHCNPYATYFYSDGQGISDITSIEIPVDSTRAYLYSNAISHIPAGKYVYCSLAYLV